MKRILILFTICLLITSCSSEKKEAQEVETDNSIALDLLPMYGSTPEYGNLQKNEEQLDADRIFLENSDEIEPSRKQACINHLEMGWHYLDNKELGMAMKRANQAWQLNSVNPDVYVLFAAILNADEDHEGAIDMLERGLAINSMNAAIYQIYQAEAIQIFKTYNDKSYLIKLKKHINSINPADFPQPELLRQIDAEIAPYL